ncbi:MAG: hypothetical protein HQK55_06485 [Deltaproteobacteria bacterium]|nr:hypothetical protein [Deltaproteobacteria bacterium]
MGRIEIKQLLTAAIVLGIILVPMVGFNTPVFDGKRALMIWGLVFFIAAVGIISAGIKRRRTPSQEKKSSLAIFWQAWTNKFQSVPTKHYVAGLLILAIAFPFLAGNYMLDVSIICLIYIALGLGLNITVGLAGLLDMGYVAFYAVGAYTFSLLNLNFGIGFWMCLPVSMLFGACAAALGGYPPI